MNKIKNVFVVFLVLLFVLFSGSVFAQGQTSTTPAQPAQTEDPDKEWKENFDKKLDTTIQILNVVKEEMKEDDADTVKEALDKDNEEEDASLKNSVRSIIRKTGRVWRKVKEIVAEDEEPEDTALSEGEEKAADAELSKKIDTTIGIMQVMKEELDKIREDDTADVPVKEEQQEQN